MSLSLLDFLRLVVPEDGEKFVATLGDGRFTQHPAGTTHEGMVQAIERFKDSGLNVYHANASYISAAAGRRQANAKELKSLWVDIDVGKASGKCYDTQREAVNALVLFCKQTQFFRPTIIVSSGKGIHAYWCFPSAIARGQWQPLADAFKVFTQAHGLLCDPSVTADAARVLRPIETMWRSTKGEPESYPVYIINAKPECCYEPEALEQFFGVGLPLPAVAAEPVPEATPALEPEQPVETPPVPKLREFDPAPNRALGTTDEVVQYPPADAEKIAAQCGQIGRFKESGDLPYEVWRLAVGVVLYAEDGPALVHKWSANGFSEYEYSDTQKKLDTWNATGASLCASFKEADPNGPCATCTQTCRSPVTLGWGVTAKPVEYTNEEGVQVEFEPLAFPENARIMPDRTLQVQIDENVGTKRDPEFVRVWKTATRIPFYIETIVRTVSGKVESDVVFFPRDGERHEFTFPHEIIQDARALARCFNGHGVYVENVKALGEFIVSYIEVLKTRAADTPTVTQMGWIGRDKFVVGDVMITPTDRKKIRVDSNLATKVSLFDDSGPIQDWVEGIDRLYNVPNGEPYQFIVGAGIGSILIAVMDAEEFNGISIAMSSDESGYGKSTVQKASLAAFGRVERNVNVLTGDDVSIGAAELQCSTFNNVPHLFDEMTHKSGQDVSHLLYMQANGIGRQRLRRDGGARQANAAWRGFAFVNGNKNFFLKLSDAQVNPEAAQMRMFEFPLENYPKLESLKNSANLFELTNSLRSGYGGVAVKVIRFVMQNWNRVHMLLWETASDIAKHCGERHGKERFHVYTVACVIVAVKIMKHLGLVRFDAPNLYRFSLAHMNQMRISVADIARSIEDEFSAMMATFLGEGRVIITREMNSTSDAPIRKMPVARVIHNLQEVVVTHDGLMDYCRNNNKSVTKFRRELAAAGFFKEDTLIQGDGYIDVRPEIYAIGAGVTSCPVPDMKCYLLNYDRVASDLAAEKNRQIVVEAVSSEIFRQQEAARASHARSQEGANSE